MHEWRWFKQKQPRKQRSAQLSRRDRHSLLASCRGPEIGLLPAVERILRDEFPGIEIRLLSDYSPVLAKALMRRKIDAAFIRPEEPMGDLSYRRVRTDPLIFVFSERPPLSFICQYCYFGHTTLIVVGGVGYYSVRTIHQIGCRIKRKPGRDAGRAFF